MNERSDFFKFLRSLGAREIASGSKHRRWQIGERILPVPSDISGTRDFKNYKALAKRMALEEGLIKPAEKRGHKPASAAPVKSQPALKPSQRMRRTSPGTREDLEAWNRREAERWRSSYFEGVRPMSETSPKRQVMRAEERLPVVEHILREAGKPLRVPEILMAAGWGENANQAVQRLFRARPDRFRRTRGNVKKNERWELVPPCPAEEPPQQPPPTDEPAPETPPPAEDTELLGTLQLIVDEFRNSVYNPNCAVYSIGRLEEILYQRKKQRAAPPAST